MSQKKPSPPDEAEVIRRWFSPLRDHHLDSKSVERMRANLHRQVAQQSPIQDDVAASRASESSTLNRWWSRKIAVPAPLAIAVTFALIGLSVDVLRDRMVASPAIRDKAKRTPGDRFESTTRTMPFEAVERQVEMQQTFIGGIGLVDSTILYPDPEMIK